MLGKALDGPALARRVPAFKENDDLAPIELHPFLHLQQFDLQLLFLPLIELAADLLLVGIFPGLEEPADRVTVPADVRETPGGACRRIVGSFGLHGFLRLALAGFRDLL